MSQLLIAIATLCQVSATGDFTSVPRYQRVCQVHLLRCVWENNNPKRSVEKAEENLPWCVVNGESK